MDTYGVKVQRELYAVPAGQRLPVGYAAWKAAARTVLRPEVFDYIQGGAGRENTQQANLEAFRRLYLLPRPLSAVEKGPRDLSVELFGGRQSSPLLLAPVGKLGCVHPAGEVAAADGARRAGIACVVSCLGSRVLEEVAEAYGDGTRWFQLYPASNPRISESLVRRAEASGYRALVITVDTPVMGWRPRDLRHGYYPFSHGHGLGNYLCDPAFRAELGFDPADDPGRSLEYFLRVLAHDTLGWSELTAIRCMTSLPVLVKGILHPQDAQAALQHGFDGLIVSNHGGRHLDGVIPALYALPGIVRAVDGRIPVLFDSGVRTGDDVLKAMALGARAVLVGRPYVYGLAVAGVEGVSAVLRQLVAELDISMIHARCRTLNDVHMTPSLVKSLPDGGSPSF